MGFRTIREHDALGKRSIHQHANITFKEESRTS